MHSLQPLLAELARCERPRTPVSSLSGLQPGGLAQGPEEKCGRAGRAAASVVSHIKLSSQRARAALGRRGPLPAVSGNVANARRGFRKIRLLINFPFNPDIRLNFEQGK